MAKPTVEKKEKFYLYLFIVAALSLSAVARAQGPSSSNEQTVIYLSADESKFLSLINTFRKKLGLHELRLHSGLQVAAEKHSKWMANQDALTKKDALSHYGPTPTTAFSDRIKLEGYANYTMIGENIACGSQSAEGTFSQFAFSPPHLQNMLSPRYRNIGVARAGNGDEDCPYYWTNDFGSKAAVATDAPAVDSIDKIAAAIDLSLGQDSQSSNTLGKLLAQRAPLVEPSEGLKLQCVIPYTLGNGVLVSGYELQTTVDITPSADSYMMKVSFQQLGTQNRFVSYSISGAAVVKSAFYPLVTLFSAPTDKVGGFMIQVDLASGRAQFDPYSGQGGKSGLINCKVQ